MVKMGQKGVWAVPEDAKCEKEARGGRDIRNIRQDSRGLTDLGLGNLGLDPKRPRGVEKPLPSSL